MTGAVVAFVAAFAATATAQDVPGDRSPLAFDLVADARAADGPQVFAHYFTPFPISLDNEPADTDFYATEFLDPAGEGGKHAGYGGLLRQRPLPRPVSERDDWDVADMETEVRRAIDAGIDGFTLDLLGIEGVHWERAQTMLEAAARVDPDFEIVLMPDGNTATVEDPVALADAIVDIADHPSTYHLDDGRLVVAPFLPERVGADWWADWIGLMEDRGIEVALVPTVLDYFGTVDSFADISYGMSIFRTGSPSSVKSLPDMGTDAHERGLLWMHPVALQDVRPKSSNFSEANNTEALRAMWESASEVDAEWVQLITWNDYSEGTELAPSTNTGWSPLDITAFYATAFKSGTAPEIVRDRVYVSHRTHAVDAKPTGGQTSLMRLREGSSPARDTVEVLSFLRAGAKVTVDVGDSRYTYAAPAGVHAELFPLEPGTITVEAVAADGAVSAVTSPSVVSAEPEVQDLQYHFAGSGRDMRSAPPDEGGVPSTDPPGSLDTAPANAAPEATDKTTPASGSDLTMWGAVVLIVAVVVVVSVVVISGRRRSRPPPGGPPVGTTT